MAKISNLGEVVGRSGPRDEQWLIEIAADGHGRNFTNFTFGACITLRTPRPVARSIAA